MTKVRTLKTPSKVSDLTFDELYDEISYDWEKKAEALQARRWRTLRRAEEGERYAVSKIRPVY